MTNPAKTTTPNTSDTHPHTDLSSTGQPDTGPAKLVASQKTLSFWQTLSSVLYAMLGVQGRKNAQASLEEGHIGMFIFVGLLVVGCFILIVALVAYIAISSGW